MLGVSSGVQMFKEGVQVARGVMSRGMQGVRSGASKVRYPYDTQTAQRVATAVERGATAVSSRLGGVGRSFGGRADARLGMAGEVAGKRLGGMRAGYHTRIAGANRAVSKGFNTMAEHPFKTMMGVGVGTSIGAAGVTAGIRNRRNNNQQY